VSIEQQEETANNVVAFALPAHREPPLTAAELAEYRRIRPALLQLLEEWQKIRVSCPVARRTLG
jgi:hypothetical protein